MVMILPSRCRLAAPSAEDFVAEVCRRSTGTRWGPIWPRPHLDASCMRLAQRAEFVEIGHRALARACSMLDAFEQLGHAFAAGRTLAARFVDEELQEVLGHVEHVAFRAEDDDRAAGGDVLVGDGAVEVRGGHALARRRRRPAPPWPPRRPPRPSSSATVMPMGNSYTPGRAQSPETLKSLWPVDFSVPMLLNQSAPLARMHDDPGEGLHVVDDRRMAQVAGVDGEGRAVARLAALAFQRFDQGRLLAADVGPRAHVDLDVEVESLAAGDVLAQQILLAAALRARLPDAGGGRCIRPAGRRCRAGRRSPRRRSSCPRTPGRRSRRGSRGP